MGEYRLRHCASNAMFASEDMFSDGGAKPPPPPASHADEEEEWSASDSDDEVEKKRGLTVAVRGKDDERGWSNDERDESHSPVVPHCALNPVAANRGDMGGTFMPPMGDASPAYADPLGTPPHAVGVSMDKPSAAAMRKAQLDRMRDQEQRKRAERIAGSGVAV